MYYGSERLADHMLAFPGRAGDCATMAELAALSADSVGLVGMTAIASGMITGPQATSGDPLHFHNWPTEWLACYGARGFMDKDPLPRWAIVSGAPARWSEVVQHLPPHDSGREVVCAARAFGFLEGVVTPVRTLGGHLGLVSVGGPGGAIGPEEFHFLSVISTAALHRAEALAQGRGARLPPSLSRREQECLTLMIHGLTEREIAEQLGIREVTARFHLDNARQKTGAKSRTHLAGIAGLWLTNRTNTAPKEQTVKKKMTAPL